MNYGFRDNQPFLKDDDMAILFDDLPSIPDNVYHLLFPVMDEIERRAPNISIGEAKAMLAAKVKEIMPETVQHRNEGGDGADNTGSDGADNKGSDGTGNNGTAGPLEQFVTAVSGGNPREIVSLKEKYQINIPIEFSNLNEATKKTRNLLIAYSIMSPEQFDRYIENQWIGGNYAPSADEKKLEYAKKQLDSGSWTQEQHDTYIETIIDPVGTSGGKATAKEAAKTATKYGEYADDARRTLVQIRGIAGSIERTTFSLEGWGGTIASIIKNATGTQDEVSLWKVRFRGFVNSATINSLPPGVASDKDIELAKSGFPNEQWDKDKLLQWIEGYEKLAIYNQAYYSFGESYLIDNQSRKGMDTGWRNSQEKKTAETEIASVKYKRDGSSTPAAGLPKTTGDSSVPVVSTQGAFDSLPSGAKFKKPNDNTIYIKP